MRILLIVILLSFMTGCLSSFKVTGYSGGTVIIYCHYSTEERSNEKYFCLGQYSYIYSLSCEDQIRTGLNNTWQHSGRFSLYDNTGGNYFKVIIRQLTRQDEGTYWCGVDIPTALDSYTKVELEVKKDDCCEKSVTETAFLGGEATIRCNYPEDHEDNIKYFCKVDSESDCENKISDTYHEKPRRYSLSKRRRERFSTVTISDLTEDDTGTYWCGLETSRTEQRYITLITQVKLRVIMMSRSPATPSSPTSSSTPGTSTYPVPSSISPSSSTSSSIPIVLVMIMVSVSLAVLVLTVILFTVYRWKCNKVQGPASSSRQTSSRPNTNPGNSEEGDQDYENDPATDTMVYIGTDDAVYQTLNTNTAIQDSTYQTLNPNTAIQDSTYQTLNPNTAIQDSTYQTLNPNTAIQDSIYQTLNPNTAIQDSTYQTLNPNTAIQDSTYQNLNPKTANQV
ncbi:polymeric immunoglobulin receptor-like isoform X2 [Oncorhynchus nerka]|uniref:polymeric immunoglobulin receptor-like isoform X2 n=1 Tax=Oncorhynchus nerka TaxID=8023 RepID=UPI0031B8736B